jgi:hypothetical protein
MIETNELIELTATTTTASTVTMSSENGEDLKFNNIQSNNFDLCGKVIIKARFLTFFYLFQTFCCSIHEIFVSDRLN